MVIAIATCINVSSAIAPSLSLAGSKSVIAYLTITTCDITKINELKT
ncbi:hypothetical protein [Pseudanabaena sp. Chao 1811]|nr:hypothetical protein [Pseudanabaena sp. Chao 1811]